MFDISFFEIIVISMIALIVIGPERLPYVARTLGHLIGKCRQFIYSIKTDIHNEIRMEELKHMHHTMQESVHSIKDSVRKEINEIKSTAPSAPQDKTAETQPTANPELSKANTPEKNPKSPQNESSNNGPSSSP